MAKERLEVELVAQAQQAISELQKYVKATAGATKEIGKHAKEAKTASEKVGSLTKAIKNYWVEIIAGIAIGKKFLSLLSDMAKSYMESEDVVVALNNAMKNTGTYTPIASQAIQDMATGLQKVVAFSDEAIIAAATFLESLTGLNADGIQKIMPSILDLAVGMGWDLPKAATEVSKALAGGTSALSRYGIEIDKTKSTGDKLIFVQDEITKRWGGRALEAGKTYSGQLEIMKNSIDNVKERLGAMALEVLPFWLAQLDKASAGLDKFLDAIQGIDREQEKQRKVMESMSKKELQQEIALIQKRIDKYKENAKAINEETKNMELSKAGRKAAAANLVTEIELLSSAKHELNIYNNLFKTYDERMKAGTKTGDAFTTGLNKTANGLEFIKGEMKNYNDSVLGYSDELVRAKEAEAAYNEELYNTDMMIQSLAVDMGYLGETIDQLAGIPIKIQMPEILAKEQLAEQIKAWQDALSYATDYTSQVNDLFQQGYKNRSIEIDNEYKKRKDYIDKNITDETANKEATAALDEEFRIKRGQLMQKEAKTEKVFAIFSSIINTAEAVTKFLAKGRIGLAIAAGVMGAVKTALIAAQPIPAYQLGGIKRQVGGSMYGDRQPAMLERGERVIPKETASRNVAALNRMEAGEGGGAPVNIYLGGKLLYSTMQRAFRNGQIVVDARAIR